VDALSPQIIKVFAAGVILSTSFIHVLPDSWAFVAMCTVMGTLMAMAILSRVSIYSPLPLRKDHDSVVENEKDSAKLKDLVGEEDNTDFVPKVENDPFAKLKD
ncbi:zinc transporter 8-like, partial [Trifolium medium]|nr:zinc transporter 8-like [Trifolium medium]